MKSVVLLSAGLDSTTNLYAALKTGFEVDAVLTFDYGQKAAPQELAHARKIAETLKVKHEVISLPFLGGIGSSSLTSNKQAVPTAGAVDINSLEKSHETAKAVWVPNRNGIFLNIAAAYAEASGADCVVPGFNAEEAATFPDNTYEFMVALSNSFAYSTRNKVQVHCFTHQLNKKQLAAYALELGVPMELVWPCYFSEKLPCGVCESCQRDKRALKLNNVDVSKLFKDPS